MANALEALSVQLENAGARQKIAEKFRGFIRDRLREASFAEKVLPPQNVTRDECQISVNHEGLTKIVHLEPNSRAMVVNFRSGPQAQLIRGTRVEIPFLTIMSDMFEKPEQEFLVYDYEIGKVVEQNSVRDIGEIQDREFLIHCEAAVQAHQAEANGGVTDLNITGYAAAVKESIIKGEGAINGGADDGVVHPVQRPDIVGLVNLLEGRRLMADSLLFTSPDLNDVLTWVQADAGDKIQSETYVKGYTYNTLLGKKVIRSIKTDILRRGNIYAFTTPDFLGRFYVLNQPKFWIDKVINVVKFVAWKDIGMSLVNTASVAKLELYGGSATTNTDGILADVTPLPEDQLGKENNRAGVGGYEPSVVSF